MIYISMFLSAIGLGLVVGIFLGISMERLERLGNLFGEDKADE